jgi:hypothetical protein
MAVSYPARPRAMPDLKAEYMPPVEGIRVSRHPWQAGDTKTAALPIQGFVERDARSMMPRAWVPDIMYWNHYVSAS